MSMNFGGSNPAVVAPRKDDISAIDDLLGDFDQHTSKAIKENETKNTCMYCNAGISETNFHTWAGLKWHFGHFRCAVCDTGLEGSKFSSTRTASTVLMTTTPCSPAPPVVFTLPMYSFLPSFLPFLFLFLGFFFSHVCLLQMSEALGKKYHAACFCCSVCEEPLTGAFNMDTDGNLFCKEDWLIREGLVCVVCNELIHGANVSLGGNKYHPECLTCQECHQSIAGKEYIIMDNKLFCGSHFRCAACNMALDGQVVAALGRKYHVGHFNCAGCKKSLVGEPFYERAEKPWCGPCYQKNTNL